ncbi:M1 family metallopeptidase [Bacillus taeanensis]|nr:M1 family metallopeptidase [Bacillus taeanensis]
MDEEEFLSPNSKLDRTFMPKEVPSGSRSQYDIMLTMTDEGEFNIETKVIIENTSQDNWNNLIFYFIPNIFTEDTAQDLNYPLESPATIKFHKVAIDGNQTDFTLEEDTLTIPLQNQLEPNKQITVEFIYEFTLPDNGLRFTRKNGNYYLSQFYPMVATYRDNKWNKADYMFRGETYHTAFSDYKFEYDIPEEYTFVSTYDNENFPSKNKDSFKVSNVKDIFVAVIKKTLVVQRMSGNVNIRVFGFEEKHDLYTEISEVATNAQSYFEKNIGPYPFKQLDIILDSLGMECPGIVTASSVYNSGPVKTDTLKRMVVHEIAHQWFYGIISNDPYNEAWLDEGFAEFATGLYYYSNSEQEIPYDTMAKHLEKLEPLSINLPLDKYKHNQSSYTYGKASVMLWKMFEKRGGIEEAEKFLKSYYDFYNYKEVNTKEFVRFTKHYFSFEDNAEFEDWLVLD